MKYMSIYGLRDPEPAEDAPHLDRITYNPAVRYIGMSDDPYRRVKEHTIERHAMVAQWEEEAQRLTTGSEGEALDPEDILGDYPSPMSWWLYYLWEDAKLPEVVILEPGIKTREEARDRERTWIMGAKLLGMDLYNQTNGG